MSKGESVALTGFGTFSVSQRAARTGRNPQTGATIQIKASKAPKFKAGKTLKDAVNWSALEQSIYPWRAGNILCPFLFGCE